MNIAQLERISELVNEICNVINSDKTGSHDITGVLHPFRVAVRQELKNAIWRQYLSEREQ